MNRNHTGSVPEFFVSGLHHIEIMGSNSRHVLYKERTIGGRVLFVPAVHIIMANSSIADAVALTTREMARHLVTGSPEPLYN